MLPLQLTDTGCEKVTYCWKMISVQYLRHDVEKTVSIVENARKLSLDYNLETQIPNGEHSIQQS